MEGKSRVETVGTGNWYYNSSKGLQYPAEGKVVRNDESKGVGKENNAKVVQQEEVKINKSDASSIQPLLARLINYSQVATG